MSQPTTKDEKSIRCTRCRSEFSENEIVGASACPKCGSKGTPMAMNQDVTIRINWHELRILCIWADNWIREKNVDDAHAGLQSIIRSLEAQRPQEGYFAPLTLFGEFKELSEYLQSPVEVVDTKGNTTKFDPPTKQ